MPLLHVGRDQLGVEREKKRRRLRISQRIRRESAGQSWDAGQRAVDGRRVGGRRSARRIEILADKERRIEPHAWIGIRTGLITTIENAIPGAQDQLVTDLVGQANSRSEVVRVRRNQSWTGSRLHRNDRSQHGSELRGHALGHDQAAGGKVESAELVVALFDGGKQFVTQTQIQRQFWRNPPVILPVEGVHLVVIIDVVQIIDAAAVAQAHQKGRKSRATSKLRGWVRVIRQAGSKVECAARRRRLEDGELFGTKVGPEFKRVIAMHPAQIFRQAVGVLNFVRRQEGRAAYLGDIVEGQLGQAAVPWHIWNSGEAAGKIQQFFTGLVRVDLLAL